MTQKIFRRLPVVCSCCLALAGVLSAQGAGEDGKFTVSTVDELTNTLAQIVTRKGETVVTIAAGVYDLSQIEKMHTSALLSVSNAFGKAILTIQGDPEFSRDAIVLDAGGAGRVMRIFGWSNSTTILKNLTVRNGKTESPGNNGGIVTENWGVFRFENCVFEGNIAYNYSAAVGGTGDRYFKDCLFKRNTAGGTWGRGGVINDPKGVEGCVFLENGVFGEQIKGGCVNASCTITNCVFDSNCNTGLYGRASAVFLNGGGVCIDCTFTNNFWGESADIGGVVNLKSGASVILCKFYDNSGKVASAGGAIRYDDTASETSGIIDSCEFFRNKTAGTGNGGAVAFFPRLMTNCTFIGNNGYNGGAVYVCSNIVGCVFTGNISRSKEAKQNGGAGYKCVFYDCVVTNNIGQEMSGSFSSCSVYRSKVGGASVNNLQEHRTVEADNTYFEDCELFGLWKFGVGYSNCGFNRCVIRDNPFSSGYGYLIAGRIAVTNSLLLRNTAYRMFHDYQEGFDNNIVNCSFVSNKYDILAHTYDEHPTLRVVNNLFVGNKTRTWSSDDDIGQTFNGSVYSNNYISTAQPYTGYGNINARSATAPKPMLMMERDPEHPYAPKRISALNGAGVVEAWMGEASDLAGNARLTDGRVSIGAYEWIEYYRGMTIIVR